VDHFEGKIPCAIEEFYGEQVNRQGVVPELGDDQRLSGKHPAEDGMKINAEITDFAIRNSMVEGPDPAGAPSRHRTNTDPKLGQPTTRVSDRSRYRKLAGRIIL
jgi:hypothetical protein